MIIKIAEFEVEISAKDTKYGRREKEALSAFLTQLSNCCFNSADYLKSRELKSSAKESLNYAIAFADASETADKGL